ncbi:hypothetical protein ACF0H5_010316 [Mactra antiquata]
MNFISTFLLLLGVIQYGYCYQDKTVYQCLVDKSYSSFAQLLKEANLDTMLAGKGPFTLLAPSNSAVASVDANFMSTLGRNSLLLKQVLRYHIVDAYEVIPSLTSQGTVMTSLGQPLDVAKTATGVVINNSTTVDPANADIVCNNGIIHEIDSVMVPPIFSTHNIAATMIERDDIFKDFFLYALLSNMTQLLESGEYTVFAPTDLAFGRYSHLSEIPRDPKSAFIYLEILKYHIVPGARYSYQLSDQQKLYTLHGSPITISLPGSDVNVDDAKVVEANIPASNGIIHAIDHVLYPADLLYALVQGTTSRPAFPG